MNAAWGALLLLFVPGLLGLVMLMNWLETYLTHQLVADDVALACQSTDSPDELEQTVGHLLRHVIVGSRQRQR